MSFKIFFQYDIITLMNKNKRILIDLLIVAAGTVTGTIIMVLFDFYEKFHEFSRLHEEWELDDISVGVFLLAIGLGWFAIRRIGDALRENRRVLELEREKIKAGNEKNESLRLMAGSIAHNFNNILGVVSGNLELARLAAEDCDDFPGLNNIRDAERATDNAVKISHLMLTYVGQGRMKFENVNSGRLLEEFKESFREGIPGKISLKFHISDDLSEIHGDTAKIVQLLNTLVSNSVESCGENSGEIILSNGVLDYDPSVDLQYIHDINVPKGKYLYLEVKDNGSGMSEELISKIFDPFFTTKFTGRGLGLASAVGIARMHDGTILVDSQPGKGTSVRCLFPINY